MCSLRALYLAILTLAVAGSTGAVLSAGGWPQWRGPDGQGVSTEMALPTEWSAERNIRWKAALPGTGHSSPIVWNGRVFLTAQVEGEVLPDRPAVRRMRDGKVQVDADAVGGNRRHQLLVVAIDAASGRLLWQRAAHDGGMHDHRHVRSSFAAPTPSTDGSLVFAYFGPEGLYAYDFAGQLQWKIVEPFRTKGVGAGTSPIVHGDFVIVQRDEEDGDASVIVAYDRKTGRERWRTARRIRMSWSTPIVVTAGGRAELIANGDEHVIAYDPATGRELWRVRGLGGGAMHTPLAAAGLVIVTSGCSAKKIAAIRPGPGVPDDERIAWEYARGTGCPLSNLAYGSSVYLFTEAGIVTVLDAPTGVVVHQGIRPQTPAQFMGSPVAYQGLIAITSLDGETFLLRTGASPSFVQTNSLGEPVHSSAAVSDGRIFIRGARHLFAIGAQP